MLSLSYDDSRARAYLLRVRSALGSKAHDTVLRTVAWEALARLVRATPKGFTGALRNKWTVVATRGGYVVINTSKIMRYIESGTKAHGAVKAKALYIPLTRSASIGGWHKGLVFGEDYVLAKRVKGIRARHIARSERVVVRQALRAGMLDFVRRIK